MSAAVGLALAGCLFPDFDDLRATGAPDGGKRKDGGGAIGEDDDIPPGSPPPVDPPSPADGGGDSSAPKGPVSIACTDETCGPGQFCCANLILDSDCMNEGTSLDDCNIQAFGQARTMRCDGPEDCPGVEICCFVDSHAEGGRCRAACPPPGRVVCHTAADCAGKACNQALFEDQYLTCSP